MSIFRFRVFVFVSVVCTVLMAKSIRIDSRDGIEFESPITTLGSVVKTVMHDVYTPVDDKARLYCTAFSQHRPL